MLQLIECVPNVSEGRDQKKIAELAAAIRSCERVKLLNIDANEAANRTVFTFAGEPLDVFIAAENLVSKARELIDMSAHKGEHPRMGAVDVCPFVPIAGISAAELADMADVFAQKIAETLKLPIYLYEYNAKLSHRTRLEQIRRGEYEGLADKMNEPDWAPDYGGARFDAQFGAMVTGVRDFLIAYNINLNTADVAIAKRIAEKIRQSGKTEIINGVRHHTPGLFKGVKSIGWYIADFACAQVSANITDMQAAPMHEVFEAVKTLALIEGVHATGSELIGLVPFSAIDAAGAYYAPDRSNASRIDAAIRAMGLNSVKPFDPNEQILEIKAGWMGKL